MTDTIKQVKVDNWGDFFLRNLQSLYTRGDYCDLTLQFHTNECIRVHRLVLKACTEYFENLLKQNNVSDHMRLPASLNSDVVVPIINFMYSGLLEFRPELISRLYNTAKILKMSILTSLLDTHAGPIASAPCTPNIEPSVVSMVTSTGKSPMRRPAPDTFPLSPEHATAAALMQPLPHTSTSTDLADSLPPKKLSIWKKRTTGVNSLSHTNSIVTVIPHRAVVDEPAKPTRFEWPEEETDAMPLLYSSTFDDISYDSVPIVKSINNMVKSKATPPSTGLMVMPQQRVMPVATFESVYQSANLKRPAAGHGPSPSTSTATAATAATAAPPLKKQKLVDMNDVKEFIQEQEVRKGLIAQGETEADDLDDFLPAPDNDQYDEDDAVEDDGQAANMQPSQTSSLTSSKQGTPKPILKVSEVTSPDVNTSKEVAKSPASSKKVRFSSENKVHTLTVNTNSAAAAAANKAGGVLSQSNSITLPSSTQAGPAKSSTLISSHNQQIIVQNATKSDGTGQQSPKASSNHAKIIAEVLKKYPHLVKHNKNIRLKIMQRDGPGSPSIDQGSESGGRSKVSYMVVKAESCVKTEDAQSGEASKGSAPPLSGADNVKGPWTCTPCGTPGDPTLFPTYYTYIKHLQEIHKEKFDARLCEHCGYKANKRNLLLYHLLTKHKIPPPSNYSFPKCEHCEYYALSEALLVKHRNVHSAETVPKEMFICKVCRVGFKTATALNGHIQMKSHWIGTDQRAHRCPVCNKSFSSHATMKNHVESIHKNVSIAEEVEDDPAEMGQGQEQEQPEGSGSGSGSGSQDQHFAQPDQQNQQIQVEGAEEHEAHLIQHHETQMISQPEHQEQHATYILPDVSLLSGAQQGTLLQSTEAESLSNVASGIAASLGVGVADSMVVVDQPQTVLYLDKGQLIQLQTAAGNVHGVPPNAHVQEYIVPEIMASDISQSVGVYTTGQLSQIVQYASGGIQSNEQGILTIVNPNGTIVGQVPPQALEVPPHEVPPHEVPPHEGQEACAAMEAAAMEAAAMEATGMEVTGMEATGMEATGMEATGMEPTGMEPTGMEAAAMEAAAMEGMEGMVVISDHDYAEEGAEEAVENGDGDGDGGGTGAHMALPPPDGEEAERTTQACELEIPKLVREMESEQVHTKIECCDEDISNPPPVLRRESLEGSPVESAQLDNREEFEEEASSPQSGGGDGGGDDGGCSGTSSVTPPVQSKETSEKMAALVRDWDDFEEDGTGQGHGQGQGQADVNCEPVVEEALPSRPTILLKSDMDHDDLADNLVKIT